MKVFTIVLVSLCLASLAVSEEKVEHGATSHKSARFKHGVHSSVFDQEALLGARGVSDLKDLEPEVRIRRLTTLAKAHDANSDGVIDREELKEWVLQSFRMLDHEDAQERMTEDDEDGDGSVTFAEILSKQYGYTMDELEKMSEMEHDEEDTDVAELITEDKAKFAAADLNKDDKLDEDEYLAFSQPYDFPHMFEVEMQRTMKDLDKDGDGTVSAQEFIGEDVDEETRLAELTNFEALDLDKDGKLTPEEIRPWALPDNAEVAEEEVEHLINMSDSDKDGRLTIEEIVAKEDEFVSSTATDYGRNLHFVRDEL